MRLFTPHEPLPQWCISGPQPTRFMGAFGNLVQFRRDPIGYMRNVRATYGDISSFTDGGQGVIFAFGPEYNQLVLAQAEKFHSFGFLLPGPAGSSQNRLASSLFNMNGDRHKRHRRMLLPSFQKSAVEANRDALVPLMEQLLDRWEPGQTRDMHAEMKRWSLCIASKVLYGLDVEPGTDTVGDMMEAWMDMNASPFVRFLRVNFPGTPFRHMLHHAQRLEHRILEMIRRKQASEEQETDMLALLLQARQADPASVSEEEMVGHTNVMFMAAFETTSNSLTWALFLLAQHPEVCADLLDELASLRGEAPTAAQLDRLPLLEHVIKESLRLLPPVVYSCRMATEPFDLGPYRLPKGAKVTFSHYITHHMSEIYDEPERFLPERWNEIAPSPYEFLPFGAGARMCIGASFGLFTLKMAVAMICQRYRLTVTPNARIDRRVTVAFSPKFGMPMTIAKQDRRFASSPIRGNIHETVDLTPRKAKAARRVRRAA